MLPQMSRRNYDGAPKTGKAKTRLSGRTEKTESVKGRNGRKSAKRKRRRKRSVKRNARRSGRENVRGRETGNGNGNGTAKKKEEGSEATRTAATPVGLQTGRGADLVTAGGPEAETRTERGSAGAAGTTDHYSPTAGAFRSKVTRSSLCNERTTGNLLVVSCLTLLL